MAIVEIYTRLNCGYCHRALTLLKQKKANYQEIPIDGDPKREAEMQQRSQQRTKPQIFIDGQHIGGCSELYDLERQGRLDALLNVDDVS